MENRASARIGCLLGMAAGDALGCGVDHKTLSEIYDDYGPGGLQGYDMTEDYAPVSSHTQLAAVTANGLLVALSRGRTENARKYVAAALQEWSGMLYSRRVPEQTLCWISRLPAIHRKYCKDSRLSLGFSQEMNSTPEAPLNRTDSVSALMAPVAVGLFYSPKRMEQQALSRLALETAALTHGAPEAFLSGAFLAMLIANILEQPRLPLKELCQQTIHAFLDLYSEKFLKAMDVALVLRQAIQLAENSAFEPSQVLEKMHCDNAKNCLAAAVYVCLKCEDLDSALVTAVNHSGPSAAVGAVTGAILGAVLGAENIPDFYLESLECADQLRTLATDLSTGSATAALFDLAWEQKYNGGLPV